MFVRTAPPGGCALAITAGQYRPPMAHCPLSKRSGGPFLFIPPGSIAGRDSVFASLPPKGGHAHVSAEALSGQRSPHGRSVPAAHGSRPLAAHSPCRNTSGGAFSFCTYRPRNFAGCATPFSALSPRTRCGAAIRVLRVSRLHTHPGLHIYPQLHVQSRSCASTNAHPSINL